MDIHQYNAIVLEYRNSMIVIGCISLIISLIALLVVEIYVRGKLGCRFLNLGKIKISPTLLLLIPILAMVLYYSLVISWCNTDISEGSYVTYVGVCIYESETVTLEDINLRIYVGNGHEIVPDGQHYGKCIYSKRPKVIVFWEQIDQRSYSIPSNSCITQLFYSDSMAGFVKNGLESLGRTGLMQSNAGLVVDKFYRKVGIS